MLLVNVVIIQAISGIENFANNKYNLCHVNMRTDEQGMNDIYFICTCPTEMSEQLQRDIESALPGREIQIQRVARKQSKSNFSVHNSMNVYNQIAHN